MEQEKLNNLERKILEKHPNWPQNKARWIAMHTLGIIR